MPQVPYWKKVGFRRASDAEILLRTDQGFLTALEHEGAGRM